MSTYRKEWDCCGSATETDAWEPEACPFCTATPTESALAIAVNALTEISTWSFGWDGDCGVTAVADRALDEINSVNNR